MGLDANIKDFEKALDAVKSHMDDMSCIITSTILDDFESMATEYESHLKDDIVELKDNYDDLLDENETLKTMCETLEDKIADMEA